MKRLKVFKHEIELVVNDPAAVIQAARKLYASDEAWNDRVHEDGEDGDELFVAMDSLFNSTWTIPDELVDAVAFYAGSSDLAGSVREDWYVMTETDGESGSEGVG